MWDRTLISQRGLHLSRRRPNPALSEAEGLPHTFACSTIGPAGLNLRRLAVVNEPPKAAIGSLLPKS